MSRSIRNLEEFINRYDKFIISTHESPDADGLGAEIAMLDLLKQLGKEAYIFNSDPTPEICKFIDIDSEIIILEDESQLPEDITDFAQFVLDTNDYDNIGSAYRILNTKVRELFIIDHHEGYTDKVDSNLIKADASSACEIVYSVIQHFNKEISFKSAQAIYSGLVFDTGSFKYPKTSSLTMKIASHLLKKGVTPFKVYEHLYESNSISSFQLRGRILASMEVLLGGQMIAMKLTPDMVIETGGSFSEGESSINMPFTVKGVVASLLIKQDLEGPVKVSMRTKGDLNVAEIAIKNGGGGHKNAAGFKSKLSFDETYKYAIKEMGKFFKEQI